MHISKDTARAFTLQKQGFEKRAGKATKEGLLLLLKHLGCVQIDTINVVERSHYLAFWSRLGNYGKELLDELLHPDHEVFEYWAHAASIIPIEYYRYFIPAMKKRQEELRVKARQYLKKDADLTDATLKRIKHEGPLSSKDFRSQHEGGKRTGKAGWWSWKPAKYALELMYDAGILMVSRRQNFQRYYDLTENVLPSATDTSLPTEEELQRFFITRTLDAWGLVGMQDFSQYFYPWATRTKLGVKAITPIVKQLVKEDAVSEITIARIPRTYFVLSKDLRQLQTTLDHQEYCSASLISPFDNLTWGKPRIRELFECYPSLELYVRKEKRRFGYYALNIVFENRLVGRVDPKMHRDKRTMEIRACSLEKGFKPDEKFKEQFALVIKNFNRFHKAQKCVFGTRCPHWMKTLNMAQ